MELVPTYYAKIQVVFEGRIELLLVGGGGFTRVLLILSSEYAQSCYVPIISHELLWRGAVGVANRCLFQYRILPCRVRPLGLLWAETWCQLAHGPSLVIYRAASYPFYNYVMDLCGLSVPSACWLCPELLKGFIFLYWFACIILVEKSSWSHDHIFPYYHIFIIHHY